MQKNIEITVEQLATLLWIKALDDFEDGVNITLRDKYYNFIENNSVVEGMESSEFASYKKELITFGLLVEDTDDIEFTKLGKEVIEKVSKIEKRSGLQPYEIKENKLPTYRVIKQFIENNHEVIGIALATMSLLVDFIK